MKAAHVAQIDEAELLLSEGKAGEALRLFEQVLEAGADFMAFHGRASALHMLGRSVEALADFDAALRLRPGDMAATANRSHVLQTMGRHDEALKGYDRILKSRPDMASILYSRSN